MATGKLDAFGFDPQLLREFLSESSETLERLDSLFVMLEEKPDDHTILDQIFRPIHSIKGNSSFFGLVNIKNFAHALENILQDIRNHKRHATKQIIDVLLKGTDLLREMMVRLGAGDMSTEFSREEETLLEEMNRIAAAEEESLVELSFQARRAVEALAAAEAPPEIVELVTATHAAVLKLARFVVPAMSAAEQDAGLIFRVGETVVTDEIRLIAVFIKELKQAVEDEERCEAFLRALAALARVAAKQRQDDLAESVETLRNEFSTIHESGIGFDDLMTSLLRERFDQLMAGVEVADQAAVAGAEKTPVPATSAAAGAATRETRAEEVAAGKTLRVEESKVDRFMAYVGELIIAGEVFAYIQKKLERHAELREISQEFKNANLQFNELSTELQKSLMAVRRLPVRTVLQKLPRIVRDIASAQGKEAELTIHGDDVQIDKALLEGLESPVVHMVRNSIDHGIELPAKRRRAGKPARGRIVITATADEENFRLTIRDDGQGLDLAAIKAKAVSTGLISAERARELSDAEAFRLIFSAGFSTAKKVTEVSGRGVGMDVVMSNISALHGSVDIASTPGEGTTVTLTLPMTVTLMVVDGLVARVGRDSYIIPLTDIRESLKVMAKQVSTVAGKGEMLNVRGRLYPLLRLYELLGVAAAVRDPTAGTVVLVEAEGRVGGLLVDELLGQQSVVLKDLGEQFKKLRLIRGGAILGDGRVGLVIDTGGVLAAAL